MAIAAPGKIDDETGGSLEGCLIGCGKCQRRWRTYDPAVVTQLIVLPQVEFISQRVTRPLVVDHCAAPITIREMYSRFTPKADEDGFEFISL